MTVVTIYLIAGATLFSRRRSGRRRSSLVRLAGDSACRHRRDRWLADLLGLFNLALRAGGRVMRPGTGAAWDKFIRDRVDAASAARCSDAIHGVPSKAELHAMLADAARNTAMAGKQSEQKRERGS